MIPEGLPPPLTRVLLWTDTYTSIGQLTHGPGEGPWKQYSLDGDSTRCRDNHPTFWAFLPPLHDARWEPAHGGHTAPRGVDVLVRGQEGWMYVARRDTDRSGVDAFAGSTGWMYLDVAKAEANAFPVAYLAAPTRWEVEYRERTCAVAAATENIVLSVANDGEVYRKYFLPLCQGKTFALGQYRIGLADYGRPARRYLLLGLIRGIVSRYVTKNELVDQSLRHDACLGAAHEILAYYQEHAKEL